MALKYDNLRPGYSPVTPRFAYTGVSFETNLVESCPKNVLVSEDTWTPVLNWLGLRYTACIALTSA